jgi:hypothetical protein
MLASKQSALTKRMGGAEGNEEGVLFFIKFSRSI